MEYFHSVNRNVELIHIRLKRELDRLGLKAADAARSAGEADSQGLRDVLGGRKRLSAELLAALAITTGVDVKYVLTGDESGSAVAESLSADERELISLFRAAPLAGKAAAIGALQGAVSAVPEKKSVKVKVRDGTAVGGNIEGSLQVFHQAPKGSVTGGDIVKKTRK